jgi:hypothetical protein
MKQILLMIAVVGCGSPSEAMELLQQPIVPDAVLHAVTTFFK